MTPAEFADEMRAIAQLKGDIESSHAKADELMARVLEELGYGAGIRWFRDMERWYS